MTDPLHQERRELMQAYRQLKPVESAAIKLLAVNWAPLTRTQINTGLRKFVAGEKGRLIHFDALLKTNLLVAVKDWSGQRLACNRLIIELAARELAEAGEFDDYVELARLASPLQKSHLRGAENDFIFRNPDDLIREVRIGLYLRDEDYVRGMFAMMEKNRYAYYGVSQYWSNPAPIYVAVCGNPFDAKWFAGLPESVRTAALPQILLTDLSVWRCDSAALALLQERLDQPGASAEWRRILVLASLLRGNAGRARELLDAAPKDALERAYRGLLALLQNRTDEAIRFYREALALWRKEYGKKVFFPGVVGIFYLLALFQRNSPGDMDEARKLLEAVGEHHPFRSVYLFLNYVPLLELDESAVLPQMTETLKQAANSGEMNPWPFWIASLIAYRYQPGPALAVHLPKMRAQLRLAADSGLDWLAAEMAGLIACVEETQVESLHASAFEARSGLKLLVNRVVREAPWERALKAIENTAKPESTPEASAKAPAESRLAWYIHQEQYALTGYGAELREQTRNAKGVWNKGKAVSLKRLREETGKLTCLNEHDLAVAGHIAFDRYGGAYYLNEKCWLALAGHPHLFWRDNGAPLEIGLAEPELRVRKQAKKDQVRIEFWPPCEENAKLFIAQDGLTRLKLVELKPEHRRLAEIVGAGLEAPLSAQARILASLGAVSSLVTIHSDIGGGELAAAESVEADPRPRIQIVPEGEGLRIAMLARPFGEQGSYCAPGSGGAGLIAEIAGKRLQTRRNLKLERKLADEALASCPSFGDKAEETQAWQWLTPDAESSLELLLELHELGEKAVVEWPQGEKFKVLGQAGLNRFGLRVQQQRDWFSLDGELKLDNGEVLNMQRLLELTANAQGRFIRLDENRFLALTDAFRKRLEDLRAYSEKHGKDQRLNPLALPVIEEIAEEVGEFKGDAAWRQQIERLRAAERVNPRLPSTLQAELRDYQREGFEWLARLAAWGVGACLADDMGLGKTLQAIALILDRAGEGPSLVIAPTSVGFNWRNEIDRFAPTLKVKFLGFGDRKQVLDSLQPMDVLISSYGLLQQEVAGELLASVNWRTIVLDEAQAIKNAAAKRSQQAMALQGEFKLITTGTPVENHLGELWNLFRFINPGLLGSLESFNRRFAGPIERAQDREARQRLRKLIQPFILRRTKSQVLQELPPRTEIELQVELSEREAAFYEALRRKLLDELSEDDNPIEDKRFRVLAAITKLRRACCNPRLVAPELGLSSSKLALFGEVLEELLDNRHKALVFSQFVDHLSIIRAYLDEQGIDYQYLDGQTPAAERKKRVEAFQAGQGDVFLISLKAGGVGLNLTAADYVIHMDPWWNPAVEDQASDRAHRIGQQRPVTIYRLVTQGTIEQKIVALHQQKRDLADSLLEGGEISAKIGAEELLQLMRGE
jgi:superfamily II DNA or RNA helicase